MNKKSMSLFAFMLFIQAAVCQVAPQLVFTPVISTGLSSPLDVVNAGDGTNRIFIVQRGGTIRVYDASFALLNANFLTINTNIVSGGEQGLLSLAFHPDYETNRYFFVYYTNASGGVNIDRFQTQAANPNQADAASRTNIMTIPKPYAFGNHNGGKLNFGPDGNLYFALGDSGSGGDPYNFSQRGDSLWGKMIRINVDNFTTPPYYTVPPTNPYVSDPAILDEIYNFGLRNPWRWSFDRQNNDMWIADVGQGAWEEVNAVPYAQSSAKNYGWRCYEGTHVYNSTGCQPAAAYQAPVFEYPHVFATGGFSITGGYVYRGTAYPSLFGYYICADYVTGNEWLIKQNSFGQFESFIQTGLPGNISGYGERENGELLAVSLSGVVYAISAIAPIPVKIVSFTVSRSSQGVNLLNWKTENESLLLNYTVQYSNNGISFTDVGTVSAKNLLQADYSFNHNFLSAQRAYYRLKVVNRFGGNEFSNIISIAPSEKNKQLIVSKVDGNGILLYLNKPFLEIVLYSANGALLKKERLNGLQGAYLFKINLPHGLYFINASDEANIRYQQKVMH